MHSPYEKVKLKSCIHHTIFVKEQQQIESNFHLVGRGYIGAKKDDGIKFWYRQWDGENDVYGIVLKVHILYIKGIVYNIAGLSEKKMKISRKAKIVEHKSKYPGIYFGKFRGYNKWQ